MTLTVKHASLTGAAANPAVLVDGPKWDADHAITGTVDAAQMPALTGDITMSAGTTNTALASNSVTNAKLATMAAYTIKINATGSAAVPTDVTIASLVTKASPAAGDYVMISDQAASGALKKATISTIGGAGGVSSLNTKTGAISLTVTKQVFTSSGTYTPTANMVHCIIECVGGGGGGGSATVAAATVGQYGGGGGGAGAYSRLYASAATIGASKTVTIGAAGAGGAAGSNAGTAGGATSVGSLCTAPGGGGGAFSSVASFGLGGSGGVSGTGDIVATGGAAGTGPYAATSPTTNSYMQSGFGGSSTFGGGGKAQLNGSGGGGAGNGDAGAGYGAGGSGGIAQTQNTSQPVQNAAGGNGTAGIVVITEFLVG